MSKVVKCKICEADDDCPLMTVVVEEDGKEVKYCCTHLHDEHAKQL